VKTTAPAGHLHLDSRKAERERNKLLANSEKGTRPTLPGAT
jgi:hypothetical protein